MAFFVGATEVVPVPPGNDATRGAELMSDGQGAAFWDTWVRLVATRRQLIPVDGDIDLYLHTDT